MKLRHAAALALVGWYLLIPPLGRPAPSDLSQWEVITTFDSRSLCMSLRTSDIQSWLITKGILDLSAAQLKAYVDNSRCVSEDDPRLKAK
jgi:hypothetical protein